MEYSAGHLDAGNEQGTDNLSVAFLLTGRSSRILTTAIGLVKVVIQGLLAIGHMILVVIGAVTSYVSLICNTEVLGPAALRSTQLRYLEHLATTSVDAHLSKEQREWQDQLWDAGKCLAPWSQFSLPSQSSLSDMSQIEDEDE